MPTGQKGQDGRGTVREAARGTEDEDQHHSSLRTGQENDGGLETEKRRGRMYILDHTDAGCWGHNGLQRDEDGSRETNEATPVAPRREEPEAHTRWCWWRRRTEPGGPGTLGGGHCRGRGGQGREKGPLPRGGPGEPGAGTANLLRGH